MSSNGSVNATNITEYMDYTQIPAVRYSVITVWIILDLVTLLGNILVVLVFATNRSLHSITNYYILNLAVTDSLIAIIVMPLKLMELATPLPIFVKPGLCAVIQFFLLILVFTSLLTLVVISIERWVLGSLIEIFFNWILKWKKHLSFKFVVSMAENKC